MVLYNPKIKIKIDITIDTQDIINPIFENILFAYLFCNSDIMHIVKDIIAGNTPNIIHDNSKEIILIENPIMDKALIVLSFLSSLICCFLSFFSCFSFSKSNFFLDFLFLVYFYFLHLYLFFLVFV